MSKTTNINKLKDKVKKRATDKLLGTQVSTNPGIQDGGSTENRVPVNTTTQEPVSTSTNKTINPGIQDKGYTEKQEIGSTVTQEPVHKKKDIDKKTFDLSKKLARRLKIGSVILDDYERNIVEKALKKYLDEHEIPYDL